MSLPERLRQDLVVALRARNKTEVDVIRAVIAAIENAEAVEADLSADPKIGLNHDVPRNELAHADIVGIIGRERDELAETVTRYLELGLTAEAEILDEQVVVLERYLTSLP